VAHDCLSDCLNQIVFNLRADFNPLPAALTGAAQDGNVQRRRRLPGFAPMPIPSVPIGGAPGLRSIPRIAGEEASHIGSKRLLPLLQMCWMLGRAGHGQPCPWGEAHGISHHDFSSTPRHRTLRRRWSDSGFDVPVDGILIPALKPPPPLEGFNANALTVNGVLGQATWGMLTALSAPPALGRSPPFLQRMQASVAVPVRRFDRPAIRSNAAIRRGRTLRPYTFVATI